MFGFGRPAGYAALPGEQAASRPLYACYAHRAWAERRWRERYSPKPLGQAEPAQGQPDLFGDRP